jgi:integrase
MLTKPQIDRARAQSEPYVLWDDELAGFGCRVHPTGRRSFIVKYRMPGDRKTVWHTLGRYGTLTVVEARTKAREVLKHATLGADPQADKKARAVDAGAITVRRLVDQYKAALSAGTARTKRSQGRQAAPGYIADTVLHLERFAAAHSRQAASAITRPEVVSLLNRYVDQPSVHRRMHGAIHRMYLWARRQGLVASNPTEDIETTAPPARERVLKFAELALIWHAACALDPLYRDYVRLMIATGQRRTEVAGMRWGEIDLAAGLWTLPAGRTKARRQHTIPLPTLAVGILQARQKAGPPLPAGDGIVLPSRSRDGKANAPISGWAWLKRELDKRVQLAPWQMHDFRRSLVTHCAEQGADIATLDSMLNHAASMTRGGIVGVYQKATLLEPMKGVMQLWNRLLENALAGVEGKIVRMPVRKR